MQGCVANMGFQKPSLVDSYQQINRASSEMNSPHNDGFTGWNIKQDLYQLYFHLQKALKNGPDYGNIEKEWLEQYHKEEVWNELKK